MSDAAADSWIGWQNQISNHLDEHGLLPTPTTEGLDISFDVASECWMVADTSPEDLPLLCRITDAMGSVAERPAVLLLHDDRFWRMACHREQNGTSDASTP
jgi:hypothetical protein